MFTPRLNTPTFRSSVALSVLVAAMCLSAAPLRAQTVADGKGINPDLRSPFALVAERVMPAVVSITAAKSFEHPPVEGDDMFRFFPRERGMRRDMQMPGAGSGFVITANGYVLTNNHVIADATDIEVFLPGEPEGYAAEVIGHSPTAIRSAWVTGPSRSETRWGNWLDLSPWA
jgi:serine protease Do